MTHDLPPGPNVPPTGPGSPPPAAGAPNHPNVLPPPPYQPWAGPAAQGVQPAGPQGGWGLAVAAIVLGVVSCAVPLHPFNIFIGSYGPEDLRVLGLPLAIAGLVVGIGGCSGLRKGKALAASGVFVSCLGLIMGLRMVQLSLGL
jgi:hypothetical protein